MLPILVIDDNDAVCEALQLLFDLHDLVCETASSPQQGLEMARAKRYGVVIQDMNFETDNVSGEEGIQLFHELRTIDRELPVLLITAWASLETAIKLVKEGAHDYLGKPWDDAKLVEEVKTLLARRSDAAPQEEADLCGLVYADPAMASVVAVALRVAVADVPVLITGPNGSGKEMIAQFIQANSLRRKGSFVTLNAGALPNELLESELFGAESGAFTGARQRRIGRFEEAHRGTLFLDEIGNLPLQGQMKLLRVLQSGEFSRLGSNQVRKSDVRIISATNANLSEAIADGSFREDLYFRLNVVEIKVPRLSERPADILPLAHHFLAKLPGSASKQLSPEAERMLMDYDWPGNVRELHNRLQRAALVAEGDLVTANDLGLNKDNGSGQTLKRSGEALQIESALEAVNGNISQAAARLGMSRQALYRRMEKHAIVWERRQR